MPDYKKQHFVPKFYLRNFTSDGKYLTIFNIEKRQCIPRAPYKDQCYKKYYYGADAVWESNLKTMEDLWGALFQKILMGAPLTVDDIALVRKFVIYQLHRTVASSEYALHQKEELILSSMRLACKKRGIPFDENVISLCKKRAQRGFAPSALLADSEEYVQCIHDLSIVVIDYQTEHELITSDVPVIAINPFCPHSIGYALMGIILLFPISSHKLVVFYDPKMYPDNCRSIYVRSHDEQEVNNLNILELISADKILIGKTAQFFSDIPEYAWEARRQNREQNATATFGDEDHKLIITQPRKVVFNCNFSFGRVHHQFHRIPPECREAPPRTWDKEWARKLDLKEEIMMQKVCSDFWQHSTLSKKGLRRGYRRMSTAAKVYWAKNESPH